jgi:hypothetical protein
MNFSNWINDKKSYFIFHLLHKISINLLYSIKLKRKFEKKIHIDIIHWNSSLDNGINKSFCPPPFEICCKISKYLICMAAFEFKMSAA